MSEGPPSEPETTTPEPEPQPMLIGFLQAPFLAGAEVFETTASIGSGMIDGTPPKEKAPDVSFDNKENKEV